MDISRLLPALILAFCATVSQANTLEQTFEFHQPASTGTWGEDQLDPYFNPGLGTLTRVDVIVRYTSQLQGVFLDTCTRSGPNGDCDIAGDFYVQLYHPLWLGSLNDELAKTQTWTFDPETENPNLYRGINAGDVYPESYYPTFYT